MLPTGYEALGAADRTEVDRILERLPTGMHGFDTWAFRPTQMGHVVSLYWDKQRVTCNIHPAPRAPGIHEKYSINRDTGINRSAMYTDDIDDAVGFLSSLLV